MDAECPVTKAKMKDDCRWYPVTLGDTLLESVAKSCCGQKGSLILRRIMAARYKERKNRNQSRPLQTSEININNVQFC